MALNLGYIRELGSGRGMTLGLGVRGNVGFVPEEMEAAYGSRTPAGLAVFLRLRPALTRGATQDAGHSMPMPMR
jgi:hypothetical protein